MKKFLLASEELAVEMEKLEAQLKKGTGVHVEVELVEESRRRIQELYLQVSRRKRSSLFIFFLFGSGLQHWEKSEGNGNGG